MTRFNDFGQPIGPDLGGWVAPVFPPASVMQGDIVALEPLSPGHAPALHAAYRDAPASMWTYLPFGPFPAAADLADAIEHLLRYPDWRSFVVKVDEAPLGFFAFLRIDPRGGVIEIGSIVYAPTLQKTRAATEALYLMMDRAFELGYRRLEWKCDHHNAPSRRAATRLGFTYEGTFRKAAHYKGRSRDTAWYAIVDDDWPPLRAAMRQWLSSDNFDGGGRQLHSLQSFRDAPS